jgi:hypothetical protein
MTTNQMKNSNSGVVLSDLVKAFVFLCITGTTFLGAQEHPLSNHHDEERPSYLEGVLPEARETVRIPPPPPGVAPASVRGLYMGAWTFGSERFDGLVALADTTEINSFVIDIKDVDGHLTYRSAVPIAIEIGANDQPRTRSARARLNTLREHGIYAIARIVVGQDWLLAEGKTDWAVHDSRGGFWEDRVGRKWVDVTNDSVWVYAADLASEAVLMGFSEIQFDYVRFPDEPAERMQYAVFPASGGNAERRGTIRRNLTYLRDRVHAMGVPFTIDVFGMTTSARSGMGIGQYWEDFAVLADAVLPMIYPSHYSRGDYGITFPNAEPYETVRRALLPAIERNSRLENPATIRPFLQSFSIRGVLYRAHEVREQIRAVEELGLTDWVFWNARGVYQPGSFRSSSETEIETADGS